MLSEKAKQELRTLYDEIDECITNIVHSRIHHDEKAEGLAMFKMESLMVGTLQTISWLIEHEEHYDKEIEAIKDMPSEKKNNFSTSSYPSGANAQIAYGAKYVESII